MSDKPLPCPFCGNPPSSEPHAASYDVAGTKTMWRIACQGPLDPLGLLGIFRCMAPQAVVNTEAEAIALWNMRA
jgi:hypothetical protein